MKAAKKINPLAILSLLIVMFITPLVLAIVLYLKHPIFLYHNTTNRGLLITDKLNFYSLKKISIPKSMDISLKNKYWLLFYLSSSVCEISCQNNLHKLHQITLALGKNSSKLKYGLLQVVASNTSRLKFIKPDLDLLSYFITTKEFHKFFSAFNKVSNTGAYYLVDPQGRIILYYPPNASGENIYQDLLHLLSYSTTE